MTENITNRFIGFAELKRSISIEQVLGRYGLLEKLKHNGDNLTGVCPVHQGHNPTQFRVNLARNCWICFGDCHGGGSIIDLVSRMERVGIRQAGLLLQEWFNLPPGPEPGNTPVKIVPTPTPAERPVSVPIRPFANPPLRFALGPLDGAHPYLTQRGLKPETITTFGLGACAHGALKGWIALPIHDAKGRVVAYAGRWPGEPAESSPKYKLPRGFRKSLELFNQHRAAKADPTEPLVVVEGFFGCMWVWQAGHRKVVSLMGSMLSPAQEQRILELAGHGGRVLLLFDEDEAGRKGAAEALVRLRESVAVEVLHLADGQQPDCLEPQALMQLIRPAAETEVAA